jgi:hypothetical protein
MQRGMANYARKETPGAERQDSMAWPLGLGDSEGRALEFPEATFGRWPCRRLGRGGGGGGEGGEIGDSWDERLDGPMRDKDTGLFPTVLSALVVVHHEMRVLDALTRVQRLPTGPPSHPDDPENPNGSRGVMHGRRDGEPAQESSPIVFHPPKPVGAGTDLGNMTQSAMSLAVRNVRMAWSPGCPIGTGDTALGIRPPSFHAPKVLGATKWVLHLETCQVR